jgi:hypothetical protein
MTPDSVRVSECRKVLLMRHHRLAWVIMLVLAGASRGQTQPITPKSYVCYRTVDRIRIDGKLNEKSWHGAPWTDLFVDIEGEGRPRPRFNTRVKMLWDDSCFYVAGELQEPDVWATLRERDTVIFRDNDFEMFMDPDGDTHLYYEFEMNALNTVWDLLLIKPYRDGGPPVNSWDIEGLNTAVTVQGTMNHPGDTDTGWTVELAFPWKALKECAFNNAPPNDRDQWRVNFSRVEWKVEVKSGTYAKVRDLKSGEPLAEDNWVWSPQGLVDMHYPEMWGFVQFSEKPAGSGKDVFIQHPEEKAKWVLRQIYYQQKNFFAKTHHFASGVDELGICEQKIEGYVWPPTIQCTESLYEAIVRSTDGRERWHISQDGRTWEK